MARNPIVVDKYFSGLKDSTLQYAGELIISTVIDPELQRVSDELCEVFDEEAIDQYYRHILAYSLHNQKDALIYILESRSPYGNVLPAIEEQKNNIQHEISKIDKEIFVLEASSELEKSLLYYHRLLSENRDSILYVISNEFIVKDLVAKNM
jgi:hypothetical protein